MCSVRRRSRWRRTARASSFPATTSGAATRPASHSNSCRAMSSSPRRHSACRSSTIPTIAARSRNCSTHYGSFRSAPIWSAPMRSARPSVSSRLLREAGYDEPILSTARWSKLCDYYGSQGIELGDICAGDRRQPATNNLRRRRRHRPAFRLRRPVGPPFPRSAVAIFASGWMLVRQRAKQRGVELPLIISDHCDWPELTETIREIGPAQVWVTHGREEALVRWCELAGHRRPAAASRRL